MKLVWSLALLAAALVAAPLPAAAQCGDGCPHGSHADAECGEGCPHGDYAEAPERAAVRGATARIDPGSVCFVSNRHIRPGMVPATVAGKTYYGCCPGCAEALRQSPAARSATDPRSGKQIDKAEAFIAASPDDSGRVLYFESAESYAAFSNADH